MWLDFPGLTAVSLSGITKPEGQGSSSSGSKSTGILVLTGPWLTLQVMTALDCLGTTTLCLLVRTVPTSLSLLASCIRLTRASTLLWLAAGKVVTSLSTDVGLYVQVNTMLSYLSSPVQSLPVESTMVQ